MAEQVIEFDIPKKISTNTIYSGVHWATRQHHKDLYIKSFFVIARQITAIAECDLEFDFYFKSKPLDVDNCSYMTKLIIDCLRHFGKIRDDTPNYIHSIKISSKKSSKDKVLIKILG